MTPTIQCSQPHIIIPNPIEPLPVTVDDFTSNPPPPTTLCPKPPLIPQPVLDTIPTLLATVIPSDESDSDPPTNTHTSLHAIDTALCQESKMDSLATTSESSHTATTEATMETSSTFTATHDASPTSSPKTVRKKKGGRKRKEVRCL
ncbi:hypothetical protein NC653_024184 [Populus alba x Populus x berolinensis]|uniref:Uncharacterized protein n=1 Tax=Populus alba x Populus x berolinensis TaxID=444605 RepID=A0AAD6Q6J0_9ROSI|nr:hypothetical protein NC653_024184 [Populus alba x Populus x berolinensis]